MSFGSNVAPVRVVKESVKREPWECVCTPKSGRGPDRAFRPKLNHPGLKRCGTCGEARPDNAT